MIFTNPAFHFLYLSVLAPSQKPNETLSLPEPDPEEFRSAYHYHQTFIIRDYLQDDLKRCIFVGAYTKEDQQNIRKYLEDDFVPILHVHMDSMKYLMEECDALDVTEKDKDGESSSIIAILNNPIQGIVPNTKWCGAGNIASTYHDLGSTRNIDKCCRTHDFCPIKIQSKSRQYGLTNSGSTTRSHCECDINFYDCLTKNVNESSMASFIGNMFFNVVRPYCIEGIPEHSKLQFQSSPRTWGYVRNVAEYLGYSYNFNN